MAFKKIGENLSFDVIKNILNAKQALSDEQIAKRFIKLAKQLRKVAPKAQDFLYGHAVIMHSSEASLIDQETGEPILNAKGEPVRGWFEEIKVNGKNSVKWVSPDNIKPYKNHNGDSFPELELIKAYKRWQGKPLCKDHKSDSVDGIRGIIIDTHYDPKFKRVHALFALDRKNYGDLARKVETGYANCVSMGTAVGRSVCTECGNVASVEKDYCQCIKTRSNYGEINLDLNPIELSLVVNGADPLARVRNIIAGMNQYVQQKTSRIEELKSNHCVNPTELQQLSDTVNEVQANLKKLMGLEKTAIDPKLVSVLQKQLEIETDPVKQKELKEQIDKELGLATAEPQDTANRATVGGGEGYDLQSTEADSGKVGWPPMEQENRFASQKDGGNSTQDAISKELSLLRNKVEAMNHSFEELKLLISKEEKNMNSARLRAKAKARRAYWLGGGGVNEPTPGKPKYEKEDAESIRNKEDKQMVGEPLETGSEGMHPGDKEIKEKLLRADDHSAKLSTEELEARKMKRRAYWLGGGGINEPTPGKPKYEKEDSDSIRNKEDKQMVGQPLETGSDGMHPGDKEVKEKLLRAKLRARFTKVASDKGASKWDVFAGDKLILTASASEIYGDELDENWDYVSSKEYGSDVLKLIRTEGFDEVTYLLKGAADPLAGLPAPGAPLAPAAELPPPGPEAAPATPVAEAPKGDEKKGGMDEKVNAALNTMEEKIAELRDLISGSSGSGLVDVDVNVGDKKSPMDKVLSSKEDLLKVQALLNESADELALISETLENMDKVADANKGQLLKAASEALADSETALVEASIVIDAAKKDKKEDKEDKKDKKDKADEKAEKAEKKEEAKKEKEEEKAEKAEKKEKEDKKAETANVALKSEAQKLLDDALKVRAANRTALLKAAMGEMMYDMDPMVPGGAADGMMALSPEQEKEVGNLLVQEKEEGHQLAKDKDEDEDDEEVDVEEGDEDEKDEKEEKEDKEDEDDASDAPSMCAHGPDESHTDACMMAEDMAAVAPVMASRKAKRDGIIAKASDILGKYELDLGKAENATEPTYFKAHPGGKGTVTELTSTKTPEAKVETISEIHSIMREVAESGPRGIREAAAELQEKVVEGAVKPEDVDSLVAEGKVDPAAAAYWKKYFSQANGGSFGADLSKEFAKGKKEASDNGFRVKMRRAYDIALQAQEKGLIAGTREALDVYVDEVIKFDDAAFESNRRVVANYKNLKKGSDLPRVGLEAASAAMTATASVVPDVSLIDQLGSLGWK